jgi:hypothetical protein
MTKNMENKIKITQRKMERSMLGITLKDRKKNNWIRGQTNIQDAITYLKNSKWRWAGHLARRSDDRWSAKLTFWKPNTGKRKRGRPKERWSEELRRTAGKRWKWKAKDRDKWREMGEAFVQQWTDNG